MLVGRLTPRHRESDTKVTRGHVTKQGSRILRWALIEAIQHQPAGSRPRAAKDAIIARRGKQARNIAKVAAARQLLTLVFYGLRDGQIRALSRQPAVTGARRPHDQPSLASGQARGRRFVCPAAARRPGRELE